MQASGFGLSNVYENQLNCRVLMVDDDESCLHEMAEIGEGLGYHCLKASEASEALRLIVNDPTIGIVLTDVRMDGLDGFALLQELENRFMPYRPMIGIVVAGEASFDRALEAMRCSAVDFIAKPVSFDAVSKCLRRAMARWIGLAMQFQVRTLAGFGQGPAVPEPSQQDQSVGGGAEAGLSEVVDQLLRQRQLRTKFFDSELVTSPAWDILLDLAAAGLRGERVATSSACVATQVPFSTALRYVNQLVDSKLIKRSEDPLDKRRSLLELESATMELMTSYLSSVDKLGDK